MLRSPAAGRDATVPEKAHPESFAVGHVVFGPTVLAQVDADGVCKLVMRVLQSALLLGESVGPMSRRLAQLLFQGEYVCQRQLDLFARVGRKAVIPAMLCDVRWRSTSKDVRALMARALPQ